MTTQTTIKIGDTVYFRNSESYGNIPLVVEKIYTDENYKELFGDGTIVTVRMPNRHETTVPMSALETLK